MPSPNLLQRLARAFERKNYSLNDPGFPLSIFAAAATASGITVTPDSAMRVPAVAAAIRLVSEATGTTPAKVFSRNPKASAPDHAAYGLVHDFASEWTSAAELREHLTSDAMKHGHGYARAVVVNVSVRTPSPSTRAVTPKMRGPRKVPSSPPLSSTRCPGQNESTGPTI